MMNVLRIGEFDRRITLQRQTQAVKSKFTGQKEPEVWEDVITVWAKRMYKSSREDYEAKQNVGNSVYDYMIRWPRTFAVDQKMRIKDATENEVYYIIGINKGDRKTSVTLTVEDRDNE